MKQFLLLTGILVYCTCNAATGNASDGELALLSVIAILILPLATVYFIDFLKTRIRDMRTRRMFRKHLI